MRVRKGVRDLLNRKSAWVAAAAVAVCTVFLLLEYRSHRHVDFNEDVRPILNERCVTCHGGVKRNNELSLQFRPDALAPAKSGRRAIVPGQPRESELLRRITHHDPEERMPPEGAPLTGDEIEVLRRWIEQGAPWANHWAYVKPIPAELPSVSDTAWPQDGIDYFILAHLEEERLKPSVRADCADLLRRVSLDLVGLPPTPEEVDAFCEDPSGEAYAHAVDRLLGSPRYGERWAAMWLDLARYADSKGYEKDLPRFIWRYRDWVIDAFNDDVPFDRFTIEQIAGDLLPEPTQDQLIATAFHRNTMTNEEAGTDDEEFRVAAVIDRVNTTWEVWQGTTIACVQCHGHPYDPFRHEEYYQLYAFFNSTADADRADEEPLLYEFDEVQAVRGALLRSELQAIEEQIDDRLESSYLEREFSSWLERLEAHAAQAARLPTFEGSLVTPELLRVAARADSARSPHDRALLKDFFISVTPAFAELHARREAARRELRELAFVTTPILRALPASERRVTRVFDRGNWLAHGDAVKPEVPHSMPPLGDNEPRDRLGLARWLVSPENPLTARVMVNRFWEQLFGQGIVETAEDFGTQGAAPSHPALLDWLAHQFMHEHEWSVKGLLRRIVLSSAYQQTSHVPAALVARDPQNRLLARGPRFRLTAEQTRDQALAVSGLLRNELHGPSVMPPQPEGLWNTPYNTLEWSTSDGADRYRRAVYTFWRRTVPYPSMLAFDVPTRDVCVSRRIRTNTPLQALVMLNDPVYVEAAQALAQRMMNEGGTDLEARLRRGYRLALLRHPSPAALVELRALYADALDHYQDAAEDRMALLLYGRSVPEDAEDPVLAALTVVANAILNLDDFIVKS